MFSEIAGQSPRLLSLGARTHAMIATDAAEAVAERLRRDGWTCRGCGIRLPEFMEVDHVNGHEETNLENLRSACQFCHNLRHPVWAALRGRLRIIWAPGLDQAEIHRLAWSVFLASGFSGDQLIAARLERASLAIVGCVDRRESAAAQVLGCSHPEAFFEALFTAKSMLRESDFAKLVEILDANLRFWPVAADRVNDAGARPSASLSCWKQGGFVDVAENLLERFWNSEFPGDSVEDLLRSASQDEI